MSVIGVQKLQRSLNNGLQILQKIASSQVKGIASTRLQYKQTSMPKRDSLKLQTNIHSNKTTEILKKFNPKFATGIIELADIRIDDGCLKLTFSDGSKGEAPFLWLRDNCQCSSCFDSIALGRKFLLKNLNIKAKPETVEFQDDVVTLTWDDGHISTYKGSWLHERAFTVQARQEYNNSYKLERDPWGKELTFEKFDYADLISSEEILLQWLVTLERKGVALVTNTPNDPDAGAAFVDHFAVVKYSHYGRRSPVVVRENANNVAYTNSELGLHTDLTYYDYQAGIILIQTVEQHKGTGGESVISDGLYCTELLRQKFPKAFQTLSKTNVYFWDKGNANVEFEQDKFFKISKYPVIGLDAEGQLDILRINNQVRDSHLDLPPKEVNSFYQALKLFNDILYENSYSFKMNNGDILCLDNIRCLHGRNGFESGSSRHLESCYIDWDETRCKRRRLQEKLGAELYGTK